MLGQHFLQDVTNEFKKYQQLGERAIAQIDNDAFFRSLDNTLSNSVAITVKHMAGNMHSRWRDFLTSDGEKEDRHRDTEFEKQDSDTRTELMNRWESGWALLFETIASLNENDLLKEVTIRGEPHTVLQAINRQLTHYAYHVGQIVYLARHYTGSNWQSLSIPKGMSKQFEISLRGQKRDMTDPEG